jgi:hypothetical protein
MIETVDVFHRKVFMRGEVNTVTDYFGDIADAPVESFG